MPYKTGGGGLPELYDPDNGQYTDEEKAKLLDGEISNIVMRYIFGLSGTYDPRYPIYGFHSDEYRELYVKYKLRDCKICAILPYEKIGYLLTHKDKDDKSHFFNLLGYELNDDDKKALCDEIMEGADFSKMKYSRSNEYGLLVEVPTKIYDRAKRRHIRINAIWLYDEKGQFNFVTAIPNILED